MRVLLLSCAAALIFVGFALPFLVMGKPGLLAGAIIVIAGSLAFWKVEQWTHKWLEQDTQWNRLMKADGDDIIERKSQD